MHIVRYYDAVKEGDYSIPGPAVQKVIAQKLDAAVERAYDLFSEVLLESEEHVRRVALIDAQPRTAGKAGLDKAIMSGVTPFEQYVALRAWQEETDIKKIHTFVFGDVTEDDYIPVSVKPGGSSMGIVLGATRGERKAPKYADWARNDPTLDEAQKRFMAPLEALEVVRQPNFAAATIIKGGLFTNENINAPWRYGKEYACVESPGQSKNSQKKVASAGLNLVKLFGAYPDEDARVNIAVPGLYEDYAAEGYDDDAEVKVTPSALFKAVRRSVLVNQDDQLDELVTQLFATKLVFPETATPAVKEKAEEVLFG